MNVDGREWGEFALIIATVTAICMFWISLPVYFILCTIALGAWVKWS